MKSEYWSEYNTLSLECLNQLSDTKKEEESAVADCQSAFCNQFIHLLYLRKMRKNWKSISILCYAYETWKPIGKLRKVLHISFASGFLLHQNVWKVKINYLFILWKEIEKSATYHPSSSIIVERTKSCRSSPDPTPAHLAENIHVFQKRAHFNNQNLEIFSFYILQTHVHRLQESSYSMAQAITKNVIQVWVSLF